jgi:hypothetical protein
MSATELLRSLSDEQKEILKSKSVKLNRTADELLALLKPVAVFDAAAAPARTRAGCSIAAMVVASIILTIVAFNNEGATRIGLFALVALLIVGIVVFARRLKVLRGADVSDNLGAVVVPLLRVLREDVEPGEPVQVSIDLTQPNAKSKMTSESEPYKQGVYRKIIDRLYVDPWLEGSAVFADGTRLHWSVVDHLRESQKTKKTPRGKIKTKTKRKLTTEVSVKVAFPSRRYTVTRQGDDVHHGDKRQTMTLEKSSKTAEATDHSQAFEMLVALIAEAYRGVAAHKEA